MAGRASERARWLSQAGSVAAGLIAALYVAMLATRWVIVDVRTGDPDLEHVVVPVPLNLLRAPLHVARRSTVCLPIPKVAARERERWAETLRGLRTQPEGVAFPLRCEDGSLELRRAGDRLLMVVSGGECGEVRVSLPLEATLRLLESSGGECVQPLAALDLLAAGRGELLAVDAEDAHVRITAW